MTIAPGRNLLNYRITEKIGKGGMGEVWKAEDTTLGREVAIKVLPAAWANDPERLQRFEREARLLASLNHPNVATVHGLHEVDAPGGRLRFIAMEYVPGEDLAARLRRGAFPLEETLSTARRIAQALEAAHAAGVVHRDLKPANIRMTPDGKVKVLDFGLAKGAFAEASGDPQLSPTLTSAGTRAGVVLGTAAYMSPEQAKGQPVDKRADVWAFGVVLYEMLTGDRAFRGDSVADTMASVLKLDPDFGKLPANTPAGLRRLLKRCLQKDPARRLHDIADARIEIEDVDLHAVAVEPEAPRRARVLVPVLLAAGLGLVAGAAAWSVLGPGASRIEATAPLRRSSIPLPEDRVLNLNWGANLDLSKDGSALTFAAGLDEASRVYVRRLDSFDSEVIPGTTGAFLPFFSPDGKEVAFFADGQLKKAAVLSGRGAVKALCDAPVAGAGTWAEDGWIYFTFGESRLARVRQDGGEPEMLEDVGYIYHVEALPGRAGILLTVGADSAPSVRKDTAKIVVFSPETRAVKTVFDGGYNARYLPDGYLVFQHSDGLLAVRFDLARLEATPPAIGVQPGVWTDSIWGTGRYDTAFDGTLVYAAGGDYARTIPNWVDLETGKLTALQIPPGIYNNFDLSPDGTRVAIQNGTGAEDQIFVFDSRRQTFTRLTLEGASVYPVWSHDGREVFFASSRDGKYRLYRQPVDGSAPASRLLTDEQEQSIGSDKERMPCSTTPDGKLLLIMTWEHHGRGGDVWKVPLDGSGDPEAVLATAANEIIPQISPDGRWLAYLTDRTGSYQIVVRPFPDVERREWVVSASEGYDARWAPGSDALFYRLGGSRLMRVSIGAGSEPAPGLEQQVLEVDFHDSAGSSFAVSPDGKRVLVNHPIGNSVWNKDPIRLVTGWSGEVARAVAGE